MGSEVLQLFPNGGWDVHHHIFEPVRFSYALDRHLTPPPATIKNYLDFKQKLGLTNSVLTHGLSYGADCSSLTTFTSDLGPENTRAIGVIDPSTVTPSQLQAMQRAGVRGIRVNLYRYSAMHDVEAQKTALREHARALGSHCAGWSMAFTHTHPEFWSELTPAIEREIVPTGVKLVTDHFALLKGASMLENTTSDVSKQAGFAEIVELVRAGHLFIKISAPYRVSKQAPDYADLKPLVRAFFDANPRQVLWGSDWPHTPFLEVDDLAWLTSLRSWLSAREWHMLMVTNPQSLYDSE
ncbi:uncharacterized protein KD926_008134 [Aspergillus affinis]|uniref:uncharacterized protein n=1 Tax=Aspergillus affinis TaxID=1070780 RepID=UPI0022FF16C6|nr:uncharacterized protein KD926_008134 [Aspergillus affinis]KAI9040567.1 hypothetical protein KD926_008134 [Aspergillus affinis]